MLPVDVPEHAFVSAKLSEARRPASDPNRISRHVYEFTTARRFETRYARTFRTPF